MKKIAIYFFATFLLLNSSISFGMLRRTKLKSNPKKDTRVLKLNKEKKELEQKLVQSNKKTKCLATGCCCCTVLATISSTGLAYIVYILSQLRS